MGLQEGIGRRKWGRSRWLLLALVAVALLGATAFYRYYFGTTDTAIRHAEAFLFRRMAVAQLAEQGVYRFFYATNRDAGPNTDVVAERFGSERVDDLTFGTFDAAIRPSLGLGMLVNPTQWFQNEEITLNRVGSLPRPDFVEQLREQVAKSPHRAVLVVVHGFREAYESALRKSAFLGHVLDINAPVLLFDWPGNQGSSLSGYRRARSVAEQSGQELAQLLSLVVDDVAPQQLWLVANSMGAQVVVDAFDLMSADPTFGDAATEIEHVVLTAPDVDRDDFDNTFRHQIQALADDLTVYVSSNDRALLVSRLVNRSARRGESTLSPDQLEEASRLATLMEPGGDLITLVDVTPVNRTRNFHNFSLETPEFFDDLFLRLANKETPRSRLVYEVRTPEGVVYTVLTRGR